MWGKPAATRLAAADDTAEVGSNVQLRIGDVCRVTSKMPAVLQGIGIAVRVDGDAAKQPQLLDALEKYSPLSSEASLNDLSHFDKTMTVVVEAAVPDELQTAQVVLIAAGSEMPDGSFLKPFKRNTLVIVIPGRGTAIDAPAPGTTAPSTISPGGRGSRGQSTEDN